MLNSAVGLVAARQVALGRGASDDDAIRAGLIGFVSPLAGVVLASQVEPAPTPAAQDTDSEGPPPGGAPQSFDFEPIEDACRSVKDEIREFAGDAAEVQIKAAAKHIDKFEITDSGEKTSAKSKHPEPVST